MPELLAGWSKEEITPPVCIPLAGHIARRGASTGILSRLFVRALVLQQGPLTVGILVGELLQFSNRWAARLERRLARILNTSRDHILIAATHTHAGPIVDTSPFQIFGGRFDRRARSLTHAIERRIVECVRAAAHSLASSRIAQARVRIRGIASDRNRPARNPSADEQPMFLLRLENNAGTALLGVFGCHPTVLGPANTLVSGDLHGEISRRLEESADVALVANGAAANISTRFTRRRQNPAELERLASLAARQAASARFREIDRPILAVSSKRLRLPLRDLPRTRTVRGLKRVEIKLGKKPGRLGIVAAEALRILDHLRRSRQLTGRRSVTARIRAFSLGKVCLAALPFEIYSDTGDWLWARARAVPLCYANGYWGYVPSAMAAEDDYEAIASPFDSRADDLLRETVIDLASRVRRGDRD